MAARHGLLEELRQFASRMVVALACELTRRRANRLPAKAEAKAGVAISGVNSRKFERLVGEAFRQRGFTVTGFGGSGPDGGVELGLTKNGERFLVQCRHWRKQQVGVSVVRELHEIVAAIEAHGGFVVTRGQFTREAREFAQKAKIGLIDGDTLAELTSTVSGMADEQAR